MITDESVISRDNSSYRLKVTRNVYDKIIISVFCKQRAEFPWRLRPIHSRDFAPGACSRGTLREQSSSACINEFMVILHPQEQNFRPAKCSTIFNRLNIWQKAPGQTERTWKRSLVCVLTRAKWAWTCSGSKTCRVYRPLDVDLSPELSPRGEPCETKVATEVEKGEIVYARFLKLKLILMQSYHADEIFAFIPFWSDFVLFVCSKEPVDNFVGTFVWLSFPLQRLNPLGRWKMTFARICIRRLAFVSGNSNVNIGLFWLIKTVRKNSIDAASSSSAIPRIKLWDVINVILILQVKW